MFQRHAASVGQHQPISALANECGKKWTQLDQETETGTSRKKNRRNPQGGQHEEETREEEGGVGLALRPRCMMAELPAAALDVVTFTAGQAAGAPGRDGQTQEERGGGLGLGGG